MLYVGSILRRNGIDVELLDCLAVDESRRKQDGRAPFMSAKVANPLGPGVRKRFKRYGISPDTFKARLAGLEPPELVLVTSIMTYWYTGAVECVSLAREVFPRAHIIAGGLYPSLCTGHAEKHLKADLVVPSGAMGAFYRYIEEVRGAPLVFKPSTEELSALPYPAFDLYDDPKFVPILTSLGCTYRCTYCATRFLHPRMVRRPATEMLEELRYWTERGCRRFVLYDDAFLSERELYAKPLLRGISAIAGGISFYNPNALNASMIDQETALLLKESGFAEVRLGLETADPALQIRTGGKIDRPKFEDTVACLKGAGYDSGSICVYVMAGLPLQQADQVRDTLEYVSDLGVRVSLAQYSPIPHTPLFEAHHASARYPVAEEPLFQNNALFPFAWERFTEEQMDELKALVRRKNACLNDPPPFPGA